MILKSKPIITKMIPLSKEQWKKVLKEYNQGKPKVQVKNMLLSRNTILGGGPYSTSYEDYTMYKRILCGTPTPEIVVSPKGGLISAGKRKYWWDYSNNKPIYKNSPEVIRKSMLSAYKHLNTGYALFVKPELKKK